MKKRVLVSWSSGKDSAWALHIIRQDPTFDVAGLFTVINARYQRVSMHGVRLDMLQKQAEAANLPLQVVNIPDPCTNEQCDSIMAGFVRASSSEGIECLAFGDLFLREVRSYRENQLKNTGIIPVFPLWGIPTRQIATHMMLSGVKAVITCVDSTKLSPAVAGREWNQAFLDELPASVDPCGENGEFHTFVFAGPMLRRPLGICAGEVVNRGEFVFADVLSA